MYNNSYNLMMIAIIFKYIANYIIMKLSLLNFSVSSFYCLYLPFGITAITLDH